jgi:hypothetical protein
VAQGTTGPAVESDDRVRGGTDRRGRRRPGRHRGPRHHGGLHVTDCADQLPACPHLRLLTGSGGAGWGRHVLTWPPETGPVVMSGCRCAVAPVLVPPAMRVTNLWGRVLGVVAGSSLPSRCARFVGALVTPRGLTALGTWLNRAPGLQVARWYRTAGCRLLTVRQVFQPTPRRGCSSLARAGATGAQSRAPGHTAIPDADLPARPYPDGRRTAASSRGEDLRAFRGGPPVWMGCRARPPRLPISSRRPRAGGPGARAAQWSPRPLPCACRSLLRTAGRLASGGGRRDSPAGAAPGQARRSQG